jgi:hyperosmotically inducible periplasmic protein
MKMKKLIPLLISSVLVAGVAACESGSKTSADTPNNTNEAAQAPAKEASQQAQNDATSQVRQDQLNSDIRAREQRNDATGGDDERDSDDLESEVRSKLEANLPASRLKVDEDDGTIVITGTVPTQEQLNKIPTLAQEIKGVAGVKVNAKVAPAQ